jgi:hypothetical protein
MRRHPEASLAYDTAFGVKMNRYLHSITTNWSEATRLEGGRVGFGDRCGPKIQGDYLWPYTIRLSEKAARYVENGDKIIWWCNSSKIPGIYDTRGVILKVKTGDLIALKDSLWDNSAPPKMTLQMKQEMGIDWVEIDAKEKNFPEFPHNLFSSFAIRQQKSEWRHPAEEAEELIDELIRKGGKDAENINLENIFRAHNFTLDLKNFRIKYIRCYSFPRFVYQERVWKMVDTDEVSVGSLGDREISEIPDMPLW